jgi:predicted deacetylase
MLISSGALSVLLELRYLTGTVKLTDAATSSLDFYCHLTPGAGVRHARWSAAVVVESGTKNKQQIMLGKMKGTRQAAFQSIVDMLEEFAERFKERMV